RDECPACREPGCSLCPVPVVLSFSRAPFVTPRPLRVLRNLRRGREIAAVLLNHGFGDIAGRLGVRRWMFWRRNETPPLTAAVRLRLAAESLGPTFIKFGQVVSTRPDLVPREVTRELSKLREHVPPFPAALAIAEI